MSNAWIRLEDFIEQQITRSLAELDAMIEEHEGEEREAMLRQRPKAAAKIAALVRMHYSMKADQ